MPDPLSTFIECEGIVPFTLEKLNKPVCADYPATCSHQPTHEIIDAQMLTRQLAARLPELQDLTRAKVLMAAYQASQLAISNAVVKFHDLEPFEASKTATNFLTQVQELTERSKTSQVFNLNQLIWNQLPDDDARAAWLFLNKQGGQDDQPYIIDQDAPRLESPPDQETDYDPDQETNTDE